jgi:hypothetical protein
MRTINGSNHRCSCGLPAYTLWLLISSQRHEDQLQDTKVLTQAQWSRAAEQLALDRRLHSANILFVVKQIQKMN